MPFEPRKVKRGDPIRADEWNRVQGEVARQSAIRATGGVTVQDSPSGRTIGLELPEHFFVRLTGGYGNGLYSWTEVVRQDGSWRTMARQGGLVDDPAVEANGYDDAKLHEVVRVERAVIPNCPDD